MLLRMIPPSFLLTYIIHSWWMSSQQPAIFLDRPVLTTKPMFQKKNQEHHSVSRSTLPPPQIKEFQRHHPVWSTDITHTTHRALQSWPTKLLSRYTHCFNTCPQGQCKLHVTHCAISLKAGCVHFTWFIQHPASHQMAFSTQSEDRRWNDPAIGKCGTLTLADLPLLAKY